MNDGHRTSTIARPKARDVVPPARGESRRDGREGRREGRGRGRSERVGGAARADTQSIDRPSIISDFTTPIERTKQLVPQKRGRLVVAVFSVIIALAIGAALFVLPVKSWFQQRDDLATRSGELATLDAANDRLQSEVERLQTDAGIREAARSEIDFVEAGEQRFTVLPPADATTVLPAGWPYNLISGIVALHQAEAAADAAAAVAATAPETTVAETAAPVVETSVATVVTAVTVVEPAAVPTTVPATAGAVVDPAPTNTIAVDPAAPTTNAVEPGPTVPTTLATG